MKNGLTIVIPTLRQWDYYDNVIKNITELSKDIIREFSCYEIITIENKLVNEAWNEWVEKAQYEYILIINDDIIIEKDIFIYIKRICDKRKVCCPYYSRWNNLNKVYDYSWPTWRNIVWFCFAFKKEFSPFPIDNRLKIWYWDNWIYEKFKGNIGWGWNIHHWESKTVLSPEHRERINTFIEEDKKQWEIICNENNWLCEKL